MDIIQNAIAKLKGSKKKPAPVPASPAGDPADAFSPAGRARIKAEMASKKKPVPSTKAMSVPQAAGMGAKKRDPIDRALKGSAGNSEYGKTNARALRDIL